MQKKYIYFFPALIIIIAIVSVALVIALEPEESLVESTDGILTVQGLARISQPFNIDLTDPAGGDVLFGTVYDVDPYGAYLEDAATLAFSLLDLESPNNVAVFRYESDLLMWEQVTREVKRSKESITVEVNTLGRYSLGIQPDIEAPAFLTTYDQLLSMAPAGTVGFEMSTGYMAGDGTIIQIRSSERTGGCSGIVQHGNNEEFSKIQQSARVLLNNVDTEIEFLFVARWFVNDIEGCTPAQNLEFFNNV
ncbi:MAG: hypothetical protein Q8P30_04915 [Candidatus Uhrbacteria bacterium]|nr:hypothetical protein [Candidatus Uhrbacteria bacterium]